MAASPPASLRPSRPHVRAADVLIGDMSAPWDHLFSDWRDNRWRAFLPRSAMVGRYEHFQTSCPKSLTPAMQHDMPFSAPSSTSQLHPIADITAIVSRQDVDSMEDDQYTPRHADKDCCCEMLGLETSTISDLLRQQIVPLVTVDRNLPEVEMSITKAHLDSSDEKPAFVAVSHVRSDGLANSSMNALPLCVLQDLQKSVDQSTGKQSTPFCIDTLCLPPKTEGPVPPNTIRNVFAKANIVLVVSPTFSTQNDVTAYDHLSSIAKSTWLSRLWTLQEGAIAKRLMFVFGTSLIDYDSLIPPHHYTADESLRLERLGRMSDDLNNVQLRAWKPSREWAPAGSFSKAKFELRKLLRMGYLCTPRFVYFASPEERETASGLLEACLLALYSTSVDQGDVCARLNTLEELTRAVFG